MCRNKNNLTFKEQRDLAIWERNMLALFLANVLNLDNKNNGCGFYNDSKTGDRIISLCDGQMTFRVSDDFNLGALPKIINNNNVRSRQHMWNEVKKFCKIKERK